MEAPLPADALPESLKSTIDAWRKKWAPIAASSCVTGPLAEQAFSSTKAVEAGLQRLENFRICGDCDGTGLKKLTYTFQTLTITCTTCKGDAIVELDARLDVPDLD